MSQFLQNKEEMELGYMGGVVIKGLGNKGEREFHWQNHLWIHRKLLGHHQPPMQLPASRAPALTQPAQGISRNHLPRAWVVLLSVVLNLPSPLPSLGRVHSCPNLS